MTEKFNYPLIHAATGDSRWGTLNTCKSPKNEFDGWLWLVPPLQPIQEGTDVDGHWNIDELRKSVGYVVPSDSTTDPVEAAALVYLKADNTIIPVPKSLDEALFGKWESIAISAGNKGKLFNFSVPVVPARFYRTLSEKHKYHYLQHNFSQVQIPNKGPSQAYLKETPQPLSYDPKTMTATQAPKPVTAFTFDVSRVFALDLDPSGIPFKDSSAAGTALNNKRPAPEPTTQANSSAPQTPETTIQPTTTTSPVPEKEPETTKPPSKRARKNTAKASEPGVPKSTGGRKKSTPAPVPTPAPAPVPAAEQIVTPVVVPAPVVEIPKPVEIPVVPLPNPVKPSSPSNTGPKNKQNVITLIRKIREDPRFEKIKSNPLQKIPERIGEQPSSPQTKKTLLLFAQFADSYLSDEWALEQTPKDDFLDSLFGNV